MDRDATDSGLERQPASITEATFHPAPGDFLEVSVVIPCLNEANSLGICVDKAVNALRAANLRGEVVVADNGSTDGSIEIAAKHGARIVHVAQRGYGAALNAGMQASHGRFIVMGDADDSYDFSQVPAFVAKWREGFDVVMGNRFRGGIKPGAMPWSHRYIGNPGLTAVMKFFLTQASAIACAAFAAFRARFTTAWMFGPREWNWGRNL